MNKIYVDIFTIEIARHHIWRRVTRNRLDAHSSSTACTYKKQIHVIRKQVKYKRHNITDTE
jgi:hypothetical protein